MKVYAINGSPRKHNNTATLLQKAIEGVTSVTEISKEKLEMETIHLYDYTYTGCRSCFACKKLNGASYGKCAVKDDLQGILEKLAEADLILFGSPVYFGNISAQMHALLERLLFQYGVYDNDYSSIAPKKMKTAFIYSMNVTEKVMEENHYKDILGIFEFQVGNIFTKPEVLYVNDTYQFSDYSKYMVECFDESKKAEVREKQFPIDCKNAYELGAKLAKAVLKEE